MRRCSYLYESGRQCSEDALLDGEFCDDHERVHEQFEPLADSPFRRFFVRLAALLLLLAFLIPFYYTIKTLYLGSLLEVQESR